MDDHHVTIREFTRDDQQAVSEVFRSGWEVYKSEDGNALPPHTYDKYVRTCFDDDMGDIYKHYMSSGDDGVFFVLCVDGEVAGTVGLQARKDNSMELRRMSVKSQFRRRGFGMKLIQRCGEWARERNIAKIWLTTGSFMNLAKRLYSSDKSPFKFVSEETMRFENNNESWDVRISTFEWIL